MIQLYHYTCDHGREAIGESGHLKPPVELVDSSTYADWPMWRRTFSAWGHSPLTQITRNNVRNLSLVWSRALGPGVQEGTPLVYNGTMFFPNPLDVIHAIDARTGDLLWQYRRQLPDDLAKFFPTPTTNRNIAIYDNLIIDTSAGVQGDFSGGWFEDTPPPPAGNGGATLVLANLSATRLLTAGPR